MYNLERFHQEIKARLRNTYLPNGSRATQNELAKAVYLSVAELSKRLSGAKGTRLTQENIRDIVLTLARWDALGTEAEVVELLNLVECPTFSGEEWAAPPLSRLKRLDSREGNRVVSSRHNLPLALSGFVGRSEEIEQCLQLLAGTRLLTITGVGGVGKTRLAIELADRLLAEGVGGYPDGIYLVRLDALNDDHLVAPLVATTLGLREESVRPLLDTLADYLRDKRLLLVLDNCEHLVEAVAQLAETLLSRCAHFNILATSREPLLVPGETSWQLPTLTLPAAAQLADLTAVRSSEAVSLFIKRASSVLPGWSLNSGNAAAVVEICQRLDGIPLAIELAAARVKLLAVQEIAAGLRESILVLGSGSRTASIRQQTIRASIEWGYQLLSMDEQQTLARLAVFSGGWDLSAAEAVCAADGVAGNTLNLLAQLLQKSLLEASAGGEMARYRLLDTIRHYAKERLEASGEDEATHHRHLDYYLQLAEAAAPQLRGPEQVAWLAQLRQEHDNLRLAISWSLVHEPTAALRLAVALWQFWSVNSYFSEGRAQLKAVIEAASEVAERRTLAWALHGAGVLALAQSDLQTSRELEQQALDWGQQSGDGRLVAAALRSLGDITRTENNYVAAILRYEQSLERSRQAGDQLGIADTLLKTGYVANLQGNYLLARTYLEQALDIYQQVGDKRGILNVLEALGGNAEELDDYPAAEALYTEGLTATRELGDQWLIGNFLFDVAAVSVLQGRYQVAALRYGECLTIFRKLGVRSGIAHTLNGLGDVAYWQGDYPTARRRFEEGLSLQREMNNRRGIANALYSLGMVETDAGEWQAAARYYAAALPIYQAIASKRGVALSLLGFGSMAQGEGDLTAAATSYYECLALVREAQSKTIAASIMVAISSLSATCRGVKVAEAVAPLLGFVNTLISDGNIQLSSFHRSLFEQTTMRVRQWLAEPTFAALWQQGAAGELVAMLDAAAALLAQAG